MIQKEWIFTQPDESLIEVFTKELYISPHIASILLNRGIKTVTEARQFLNADIFELHNPFLLPDMEKAVERIREAISKNEKILIYGDRDVDGVTSISILLNTFRLLKVEPLWYIPTHEGYGLHKESIEKFLNQKISLIITVDCGISDIYACEFARKNNIDVIITDHHEPSENLPPAFAIINPKLPYSKYPFRELAGCAVALKLSHAIMMSFGKYYNDEITAIDIETTGLHPQFDEICEIAAIKTKNGVILDEFHSLIKPQRNIPFHVTKIHGITNDMCQSAPDIKTVLQLFLKFINGSILLVHNADFDISFIRYNLKKHLNRTLENDVIDTLTLSRNFFPFRSHSLTSLMQDLKIEGHQPHRALDDAHITLKLFEKIQKIQNTKLRFFIEENLDLVSIGTIADEMPLVTENRILVKHGLDSLKRTKKIGLGILVDKFYEGEITSKSLSFDIIPLLNACGRLGQPEITVELLTSQSITKAQELCEKIDEINEKRKQRQQTNVEIFMELAEKQCNLEYDKLLLVTADNIEHGVTGIVASQLVRIYNKPVILLIEENEIATGAGRAPQYFDLYQAIYECRQLLIKYGGHAQAVGLTLYTENIPLLKQKLLKIAEEKIKSQDMLQKIQIDSIISANEINSKKFINELKTIEPFGVGNPIPTFLIDGVEIIETELFGSKNEHIRLKFLKDKKVFSAIGFGLKHLFDFINANRDKKFNLLIQLYGDIYKEKEFTKIQLLDLKISDTSFSK